MDEDRVSVGEELTYTLRAVSHSPVPMQVTLAPFTGLEVVGAERAHRGRGSARGPTRTTVLEVRLRAVRPGHWQIGPARAVQGRDTVEAAAVVVDVAANRAATATTLNPRLRRLLEHATRRRRAAGGRPAGLDRYRAGRRAGGRRHRGLVSAGSPAAASPAADPAAAGDRRGLELPQAAPSGIAATRNIRGRWYDLFVSHQVVFPLVPGRSHPRATLKYSTPVALQFFSQEERFALSSRADTLVVLPAPLRRASRGFRRRDRHRAHARPARHAAERARVGEGVAVELALSGKGTRRSGPRPRSPGPAGPRVSRARRRAGRHPEGRVGGSKTFRYLVVPDSAGALALPAVSYAYFDLADGRYRSSASRRHRWR